MSVLLIAIIVFALVFDYINGFHDAANSIATIVSTKVLTPFQAVVWAAFFNFVAFFLFKDHGVANTIAKTVNKEFITLPVVLSGLLAAITWNLFTWWRGIPSSSSHTLIGGFAGAAVAHAGMQSINPEPILKTVAFIVIAPLMGMLMAYLISLWFLHSFERKLWPRVISVAVILAVVVGLGAVIVTDTSRIIGMKFDPAYQGKGLQIESVFTSSPAANMGLKKGDIILTTDRQDVDSKGAMDKLLRKHVANDTIQFHIVRDNAVKNISSAYHTGHDSRFLDIMLYGENLKWLLAAIILITMSVATFFLSRLNYATGTKVLKRLQLVSSAAFSIGHGGNDAQKVMGIIMAALIAYDPQRYHLEHMEGWVPLACYSAISLGTLSGGWKIIKTMGSRITKVTPFEGVAAETAGAITLFATEQLKIPVSTTHTITGSIIGVGATKRLSAVRWGVTVNLLWAWILTIPVSAVVAMLVYFTVHLITG
jgi:PiT family inorganic phosphate transporter